MASFVFNEFKRAVAEGEVDLGLPDDIRAVLVMTTTTFGTDYDINTMGATATPDYCDGANHDSTNGHTLTNEAVTEVTGATGYAKFDDTTDLTFTALGAGTSNNVALVLFKWQTNIGSSLPIAYIDTGGFPFNGNGGDVTIQWNANGILQFT
jgi:hypothetical protein